MRRSESVSSIARRIARGVLGACALLSAGCAAVEEQRVEPLPGPSGVNRRVQLWQTASRPVAEAPTETPEDGEATTQPGEPYRLNAVNIVRLLYDKSPLVIASREAMIAAQYGLEEFRANLSRFEPFVRADALVADFPERRDSQAVSAEVVAGFEKETFEGAIFRIEAGVSGSRVEYGEVLEGQDTVEDGSGALIRARVEVPFVGSRKRQNRVIAAAFQESTARKAMLDYLSDYRSYAGSALVYYRQALLYLDYMQAYERQLEQLETLLAHPDLDPGDETRVRSSAGDARVLIEQYQAQYWSYLLSLLQYLGIEPGEPYVLEESPPAPDRYLEQARTPDGLQELLADAYANNPRFRVLEDAIADAELQRAQAILGTYDVTAFVEGTQFPLGAETYDDRLDGWQIGAGVTVRINDTRVLGASRNKAEAEIRQFRSQIEAEQLSVQRQVATRSERLLAYHKSRPQILENIEKTTTEYEDRLNRYLARDDDQLTVDDVLTSMGMVTNAEVRLASNTSSLIDAENDLLSATGEVYRMVGISIEDNGNGTELAENGRKSEVRSQK